MGLLDRLRGTEDKQPAKAVVAAAMPMSGPGVTRVNRGRHHQTQEQWQREAWYYWDSVGELRSPTVWIANAVSQAGLHATTLDTDTGEATGPSDDARSIAVAAQALGGPSQRAGLLRLLALCWQVVGEAWIIIRARPGKSDEWRVLSGNKVQAKGERWQYTDPFTGEIVTLEKADRLIRVWCPHPDDQAKADSSVRPALPILREMEQASQTISARLVSRLIMNGILLGADELDFPKGDFDTVGGAVMDYLLTTAEANLQNPGQAAAAVPIVMNAPGELIANGGALAHIEFGSAVDGDLIELRDNGRERLAATLDMPKSVAEGTQNEANHWTAWQVSEDTYKIFIAPLLEAIGDPLTEEWMRPALVAMGSTPEAAAREALGWDTTAIVARPDDRETLESLYEKRLISDEYMLTENGVTIDAMPTDEERTRRFLEQAVTVAPTLLADPKVAEAIGLDIEISPVAAGVDAEVGAGGELEAPEPPAPVVNALPGTQGDQPDNDVPDGLVAAAEVLVKQALSKAGGRLLTNQNRGSFKDVPRHELYQHIRPGDLTGMVEVQFATPVAEAFGMRQSVLADGLCRYVEHLLRTGEAFDRDRMSWYLR